MLMLLVKMIEANSLDNDSILESLENFSDQESATNSTSYEDDYDYDIFDYDYPGLNGNDGVIKKQESKCEENGWSLLKQGDRPVLDACLESGYQVNYPPIEDKVINLYTTFYYQKLLKVDELQQTITMDIKEWTFWKDNRIKTTFRNSNGIGKFRDQIDLKPNTVADGYPIWIPSLPLHIRNLKEWKSLYDPIFLSSLAFMAYNPFTTNVTLVNATLEWVVTVFCTFDFTNFPLDTQHCPFHVKGSGSRSLKKLLYDPKNIFHSTKQYETSGFRVTIEFVGNDHGETNRVNTTDLLGIEVTLDRVIAPYLFEYYLPCMAIVIVSFISFIVPLSALPGRIALVVTQFLTLTNIFIHQMVSSNFQEKLFHIVAVYHLSRENSSTK